MILKTIAASLLIVSSLAFANPDPFVQNQKLGRGINMGNIFEAPSEGEWGVEFQDHYFDSIAAKGFQSVRIPIRWSATQRTGLEDPYQISTEFFSRIDHVINHALASGLSAIINVHHYEELFEDTTEFHSNRLSAIWRQISSRYSSYSDSLYFEVLNEPHGEITPLRWNTLFAEILQIIREENPDRTVLIGSADWGGIGGLNSLEIPDDPNLILTVHYYSPFNFTHQGASWTGSDMDIHLGTTWDGTYIQKLEVINNMEAVRSFAQRNNIPVNIGEFGAYSTADNTSRHLWTSYCARLFESYEFSWHYWEFCSGFGAYDPEAEQWIDPIADALISADTSILELESTVPSGENLVLNGDFSSNMQNWMLGVWDESGDATSAVAEEELQIEVIQTPQYNWQVQLIQSEIPLEQGQEYIVLFEARSTVPVTIGTTVSMAQTPHTRYGGTDGVMLSETMSPYAFQFTMTAADDPEANLLFNLGTEPSTIFIDNVQLIRVSDESSVGQLRHNRSQTAAFSVDAFRKLQVSFLNQTPGKVTISVFCTKGRILHTDTFNAHAGENRINLSAKFNSGPLFIKLQKGGETFVQRVVYVR